jgi:hypothetical protein
MSTNSTCTSLKGSLYSLPFVLPEKVIDVYEDVITKSFLTIKDSSHPFIVANKGNIEKYVAYLKVTWVGGQQQGRSRIPSMSVSRI